MVYVTRIDRNRSLVMLIHPLKGCNSKIADAHHETGAHLVGVMSADIHSHHPFFISVLTGDPMKVYISKNIQSQLEIMAEVNGVTMEQLVNKIAEQWLQELESMEQSYQVQQAQSAYEHSLLFA
jgi:isopentenyl phosphate kinase